MIKQTLRKIKNIIKLAYYDKSYHSISSFFPYSRDSTAIEAREKPIKKESIKKITAKRGRPKNCEVRVYAH